MTNIDFIGKRRIYYAISISLITIGILVSVIFGVNLDIQFKGGTIIKYTYTGNIDKTAVASLAAKNFGTAVDVLTDVDTITKTQRLILQFDKDASDTTQAKMYNTLTSSFQSNNLKKYQANTVTPQMGRDFINASIFAVLLASFLIVIYIWFRFRHIGGLPAGITAFIALVHDVLMAFVAFSIFRIPLNENFVAVALTILGYSINDTIVVFDRVRENRKELGHKEPFKDIVNLSINQSFARSINTTLVTFVAIAIICVFSIVYHLDSIKSFALPMMVGVVTGCYSTICIAGPLWVSWETYKEKKSKKIIYSRSSSSAVAAKPAAVSLDSVSAGTAQDAVSSKAAPAVKKISSKKKKSGKKHKH